MHTPLCDELGIEFPIFAFTHCRDVVVAVSKAGGFGVLGAVGFTPEQLEVELNWIDEHIGDHPYGVDIVIPNKYEGMDTDLSAEELEKMLRDLVPQGHLDFARKVLTDHGVPVESYRIAQVRAPVGVRGDELGHLPPALGPTLVALEEVDRAGVAQRRVVARGPHGQTVPIESHRRGEQVVGSGVRAQDLAHLEPLAAGGADGPGPTQEQQKPDTN